MDYYENSNFIHEKKIISLNEQTASFESGNNIQLKIFETNKNSQNKINSNNLNNDIEVFLNLVFF